MQITSINNQTFQARKLVPIAEYTGKILKLTPKDKEKIAKLMGKKSELTLELVSIDRLLEKKKTIIESSSLFERRCVIENEIRILEDKIKEIKLERAKKQNSKIDLMV